MMRCLNCGISVKWTQRHTISTLALPLEARLARWLNNQLPLDAYICQPCFNLLNTEDADNERLLGHLMVCRGCGVSVRGSRYYTIVADSPLLPIISQDYCQVNMTTIYACLACWTRGIRKLDQESSMALPQDVVPAVPHASLKSMSPPPLPPPLPPQPPQPPQPVHASSANDIVVPNYKRACSTSSRCIFNSCTNRTFHLIPRFIKRILIKEHNFYVPRSCRVCKSHLFSNEWHLLPQNTNVMSTFNGRQMENMLNIAKSDGDVLDFNNVEEMPNNVCQYWTGRTVTEFLELYNSIPAKYAKHPKRALALYLIKLRTGDSNRRLATLFNLSQSTIQFLLKKVHNVIQARPQII